MQLRKDNADVNGVLIVLQPPGGNLLQLCIKCSKEDFNIYNSDNADDNSVFVLQPPGANSWLGSLIGTIIGNLKITISNVHIRYEDSMRYVLKWI